MCTRHRTTRHEHRASRTSGDRSVRASDADRERTAEALRVSAGEGRLEPDELEERLEAVYSARTLADLDAVTADLPPRRERPRERPRGHWHPHGAMPLLIAAIVALAIAVHPLIWLALWPVLSLGHAGGSRARSAWRGSPS